MDEKTLQALTALANKLGTTAEYLWGVLVKQAPITGVIDLVLMAALVLLTVMWCRFVMRKTTAPKPTEEDRYPHADWEEEDAIAAWLSAGVLVSFTVLIVMLHLATAMTALVNPEYWALRQILQLIGAA